MSKQMGDLIWFARMALAFLWIFTGLTSLFFAPETGYTILAQAEITGFTADFLVYGGSLVDIGLGIWIVSGRWHQPCCIIQICIITLYSILLTIISSDFWLHPFGPLTKNIPILALILIIYSADGRYSRE